LAAFVGLDWADATHAVCLHAAGSETRAFSVLAHTPETLDAWVRTVRTRFKGPPIALGLALNQGPIGYALRTYDDLVRLPVTPLTLARDREAFAPSHAKDAPPDAELQLALRLKHRDTLTPLKPQSPAMRALEHRVAQRRRLVGDNVRTTNRLTRTLQDSCPPVLPWFHDKDPAIVCDVLAHWPPLQAAPLARRSTLERFFRAHPVRDADVIDQRLHALKSATPLTTDAGGIVPNALLGQALITQLRVILPAIAACDHAMAPRAQSPPDCPLCHAFPGAGAVLAPRLRVAFGEPRDRDASADERQPYAGMAPVTERRGHHSWVHWRLQCPTCLRHTCVEWAAAAMRPSCWARAYDHPPRDKGTSHQAAVRALAFTWSRGVVRCWQHRTPSDESVYLTALKQRGSPLMHNLAH
jgi:hypothetical protein